MSSARSNVERTDNLPESIEEAAALLGATITQMTGQPLILPRQLPPKGMHSAWSTYSNLPSTELIMRLHTLRAFLRNSSSPLVSARSIQALLMKLIGMSSALATQVLSAHEAAGAFILTPPLLSNAIRKLWCDSVVLCHGVGQSMETIAFVRSMLALAVLNPRSAKAAGGVRIAAVQVVAGLFEYHGANNDSLAQQLAPWSLEIFQTTLRALKSAGHNEPTYRIEAMKMACAAATACRRAFVKTHKLQEEINSAAANDRNQSKLVLLQGGMEAKALAEALKVVRQAITDKLPEVRWEAAHLVARLAPMLILSRPTDNAPVYALLDEAALQLAMKNLDDESAYVARQWANALARCLCTAVEYSRQRQAGRSRRSETDDGDASPGKEPKAGVVDTTGPQTTTSRFGVAKKVSVTEICLNLSKAISYLVDQFIKVGGELNAQRMGGPFSTGGRAPRVGLSLVLISLFKQQFMLGNIRDDQNVSVDTCIALTLNMLGNEMEKELNAPLATDSTSSTAPFSANQLFGGTKSRSKGDPMLVCLAASRVLRRGLSGVASEPVQLSILHSILTRLEHLETLNAHQIQVLLIEMSHLLSALGEATASSCEELVIRLTSCLAYNEHGVRHEAAIACAAIAASFPNIGRRLMQSSLVHIKTQHAELVAKLTSLETKVEEQVQARGMFRRSPKDSHQSAHGDPTLSHQYAIHGGCLLVSLLLRDLPRLPGGLPVSFVGSAITVAESLVAMHFNNQAAKSNPGALCMCAIAGFTIIAGALTTGPTMIAPHTPFLMQAWQKACTSSGEDAGLQPRHDLFCVDAMLASLVAFLKFCPDLLLTIPEALSTIVVLLENVLQLLLPTGRLGGMAMNPAVAGRYERALASLLEAFAWLPSGSFPMAADEVFKLAARNIKAAFDGNITSSILDSLVNNEDSLLTSKTLCRASSTGQSGGADELEETLAILTSECVGYGEREAVMHLMSSHDVSILPTGWTSTGSAILENFARENKESKPPTPLHDVGSWRCPLDPSASSKTRLVDAAIQAFAATFGLKSGHEQQEVVEMLESLVPTSTIQLAQLMGLNTDQIVQERILKHGADCSATTNIATVLLACLRAIPLQDSTKNDPVGLGPQWMNKAKSLLLTIMPSLSTNVLRGASESLALLVTVGVSEDAHFLQSALLHSIDDVMQGHKLDGKAKAGTEQISAARSGSLFTLSCIQRTQHNVTKLRQDRVRDRTGSTDTADDLAKEESLPLLQMMTRILPSSTYHGSFCDHFGVRAYALHAYATFLTYSGAADEYHLDEIHLQLVRKGIEMIEGNFASCWTAVTGELERGDGGEKVAYEAAFLAGVLRLMTRITPHLRNLKHENADLADRFSVMATLIMESLSSHPAVALDGLAFFEALAANRDCLSPPSTKLPYFENALLSCLPFTLNAKVSEAVFAGNEYLSSVRSVRASVQVMQRLGLSKISVSQVTDMDGTCHLMALHEKVCTVRHFVGYPLLRSLATRRQVELRLSEAVALECEVVDALGDMVKFDCRYKVKTDAFLRWILFCRFVLVGVTLPEEEDAAPISTISRAAVVMVANSRGKADALKVLSICGTPRWQVKAIAMRLLTFALEAVGKGALSIHDNINADSNFEPNLADEALKNCTQGESSSKLVYHLDDLLSATCLAASAAVDQSELKALQSSAIICLSKLVEFFGPIGDPDTDKSTILEQYLPQIISALRHALTPAEESNSNDSELLFRAGCQALESVFKIGLITDRAVALKLLRLVIPSGKSFSVFEWQRAYTQQRDFEDIDAPLTVFVELNKIICFASIYSLSSTEIRPMVLSVLDELVNEPVILAANCAAICVEGAHLLLADNLSLAGKQLSPHDARRQFDGNVNSRFASIDGVDQPLKNLIANRWACCGSYALLPHLDSNLKEDERQQACSVWVKRIAPLLLSGVHDICDCYIDLTDRVSSPSLNAVGVDTTLVGITCLRGLGSLVERCPKHSFDTSWTKEIEMILGRLWSIFIMPSIKNDCPESLTCEMLRLIPTICDFLLQMIQSESDKVRKDSALLAALLQPLNILQQGQLDFAERQNELIILTCLDAAVLLVTQRQLHHSFVRALLRLVLHIDCEFGLPARVKTGAALLMKHCMEHDAISGVEKSRVAVETAKEGNWEAWKVILSIDEGKYATDSFDYISQSLLNFDKPSSQLRLLAKLREIIIASGASPLTDRIFSHIGAPIVHILLAYGTLVMPIESPERQSACTEAAKILLVGYQQILAHGTAEEVAEFLTIVFDCFLPVIRYNGLPNHPASNPSANFALGRMCAQAITSIARTSPGPFKVTVAGLDDMERQLLEFSVRAELGGYAAADRAPVKKLNLVGFTK
ncbi:hypothetical protein MPSEU_000807600 [Mayamaea pseudoterrestris]|nr:hypothetical protein MPSEU_000807600 [Mayamaea pseudoterrestris]